MNGIAIGLCGLAFLSSWLAGRRSLGMGLAVTLFWGYFYGILRANVIASTSHFIFDSSLLGCYSSLLFGKVDREVAIRSGALSDWVMAIFAWTALLAFLPFQTPLITLVGLRGNLFFVPVLILASRMDQDQFRFVISALAALNLAAFGFGLAEYQNGVEMFYPRSAITELIYRSRDAGDGKYRIPAIFANAHSYAGTMVSSLPLLFSAMGLAGVAWWQRLLFVLGGVAALFGVLFSNTRSNFVAAAVLLLGFLFLAKMRLGFKAVLAVVVGGVMAVALSNERFQRFRTLENTEVFTDRVAGSVNRSFLEVLTEYPLGNGLGGGGTSIPSFLEDQLYRPVSVENEFARIALELGIPGLLLWGAFIIWILTRGLASDPNDPWRSARRMVWVYLVLNFASSAIGTGMLTSIPATMMFMLWCGWLVTKPKPSELLPPDRPPSTGGSPAGEMGEAPLSPLARAAEA